jgi:hypothetical protein
MKFLKKHFIITIIVLLSILIIGITIYAYWKSDFLNPNYFLGTDKLGDFGSFIGGFLGTLITLLATIYVYKTYISQKEELQSQKSELILQRELIAQQQFESTFFNMLNVHRELKNDLKLKWDETFFYSNDFNYGKEYSGVGVFEQISKDYKSIYSHFDSFDTPIESVRLKTVTEIIQELKSKVSKLKDFSQDETNPKPYLAEILDGGWSENNNKKETHKEKINFTFQLLYTNYQNILSHYCRNVYHILKYIRENEENKTLGEDSKKYKNYTNIFQSQLNIDEHFVLFYNFIHFNDKEYGVYSAIKLVNHYKFLENIGIDNLIFKKHEEFYDFVIKGSDRKIEKK